jgi:hypothetical protein
MIMTKALFKRMVDLFATTVGTPLWDTGETWYMSALTAPYTPGPDFEDLLPGDFLPDAVDSHYVTTLPSTFVVGYVPGTNTVRVQAFGDTVGDAQVLVADVTTIGKTIYGYYIYGGAGIETSWAATQPLEVPLGPLAAGDLLEFPPVRFDFNPALQY